jgi:peptidyl-prolyl cis-trans isomerase NIMA-interacting 1
MTSSKRLTTLLLIFSIGTPGCPSSHDESSDSESGSHHHAKNDQDEEQGDDNERVKLLPPDADDSHARHPTHAVEAPPQESEPPPEDEGEEASAQHLLVQYAGARRAPPEITRTKEQARARAEEALHKARSGAAFSKLVAQYSDEPHAAEREGRLGIFHHGQMVPEFDTAIFALQVNQISDIVETPFGFHVIKRLPVERIAAQHILIMHKDSMRVPPGITRTREEARARAEEVLRKARAPGADFTALAHEYTDEPQHPGRTPGDLGRFGRGQMVPEFEAAAFALRPGQISAIVETPFGFHIIKRTE